MAHFAQLDTNNIVTLVVPVNNQDILDEYGNESEILGIQLCQKLIGTCANWKQTSHNNNMRVRHARIGFSYNEELNAFVPPQPHISWTTLNPETADWESPLGPPPELTQEQIDAGCYYYWDEDSFFEDNTTGWILIDPSLPTEEPDQPIE